MSMHHHSAKLETKSLDPTTGGPPLSRRPPQVRPATADEAISQSPQAPPGATMGGDPCQPQMGSGKQPLNPKTR